MKASFLNLRSKLTLAGFEQYTDTFNEDGINGIIFVAPTNNQYFGECVDLFEDGSFSHYSQFENQELKFNIN